MSKTKSSRRTIIGALAVMTVAGVGYGVTASNTVAASKAGDGNAAISGYDVSSIHYTLRAADPTFIDSVSFTLDSTPVAGSTIKAKLNSAAGSAWYSCTNAAAVATCSTSAGSEAVASANNLQVIVAQ